ncbi:hypothetical protein A1O3_00683 [Capronia epimyces CBS 606.96]|uniref:Apple domain-containing protein n=1 Tax=Capronia epimyces CBS 606.96 TaxID=1182542 RepID=W9YHU9_9EURO|nr:uncharacterized protein A1O3_00683 [Capronia epimyces CBS 606.96]EXJ92133.1 hypothetical protein A1O3_00683 [Capronia epimyces CBS 606.96]
MLTFFHFFFFLNVALSSLGSVHGLLPEKRELSKRGSENTCPSFKSAATEWAANISFSNAASSAETPAGYTQVFSNGQVWTSGDGFLGYTTIDEYDSSICAAICDSLEECSSFKVYFEKEVGGSQSTIKCTFWAGSIDVNATFAATAVIAGCNGYTSNALTPPDGFEPPSYIGRAAIQPPPDSGSFIGSKVFNGPFNTSQCATECQSCGCKFFNTYIVSRNGVGQGQYCDMYAQKLGSEYATETGSSYGKTNYTISRSFTCGWSGDQRDTDRSSRASSVPPTTTAASSTANGGSWEHDHPWHGSWPNTKSSTTTTITSDKSSTTPGGSSTTSTRPVDSSFTPSTGAHSTFSTTSIPTRPGFSTSSWSPSEGFSSSSTTTSGAASSQTRLGVDVNSTSYLKQHDNCPSCRYDFFRSHNHHFNCRGY